jgi:hypothetical protein
MNIKMSFNDVQIHTNAIFTVLSEVPIFCIMPNSVWAYENQNENENIVWKTGEI